MIAVPLAHRGASRTPGRNKAVSLKGFLFSKDKIERVMMETKLIKGRNIRRDGRVKPEFLKLH